MTSSFRDEGYEPRDDDDAVVYVVLQPFSVTNPSRFYRVVISAQWHEYVNNNMAGDLKVYAQRTTYQEAKDYADLMNRAGK